ncbi:ribonuclease p protein subunit p30 [Anaeramoeba flamelloides]|uniref:Ribonuclease p protein subunit p30 n=1 Tax=Anaeramoeba flamelloides TaxID=1746091 RepID=A0AAV7YJ25_9EUKA|nr:ribonuclease p protein subunit p30 [Anaeramoeba flamelloides]
MFIELDFQDNGKQSNYQAISTLAQLGYDGVVFSRTINDVITKNDICTFKELDLKELDQNENSSFKNLSSLTLMKNEKKQFRQYSRLNIIISSKKNIFLLKKMENILKTYDIVAVFPQSTEIFEKCIDLPTIDIISFDLSLKYLIKIKYKQVNKAIINGLFFEIRYSSMFKTKQSQARKNTFSNAINVVKYTKGKNLLIASGANDPINLRGPYDVMNMATFFNIPFNQAKNILTANSESVISHGVMRKTYFGVIKVEDKKKIPKELEESTDEDEDEDKNKEEIEIEKEEMMIEKN